MSKQLQDAYIVAATRSPIGKAPRGMFKNVRPDDLLVRVLQSALAAVPGLDPTLIEDAIVGCAFPEAEQGLNLARMAVLLAGLPKTVGGVTVNRYCASGITAVAMAADRIERLTGIRRGLSQTRSFLKKLGLRWQRMAAIPVPPKKVSRNMWRSSSGFSLTN